MKRIGMLTAMLLVVAVLFTGCGGADAALYEEADTVLSGVQSLTGGEFALSVQYEESQGSGAYIGTFVFMRKESGALSYCQTQLDQNDQVVFCEYSDGSSVEQWMIGQGWQSLSREPYTDTELHPYLRMLSTQYERGEIREIQKQVDESGSVYTLFMDAGKMTKKQYADETSQIAVKEQTITLTVNTEGQLTAYEEQTILTDTQTQIDSSYSVTINLSKHNAVTEIQKPKLRETFY